ncbi:MAG: hypothetical protein EOO70_02285 [Myxococcaceae bacterium]|nr:MAG: hypothetical protein EOO70_02285 [Myxococcaceae bacterium]
MAMTVQELIAQLPQMPAAPVAIEALWDGDTQGWFVALCVVVVTAGHHESRVLRHFRGGGDIRLFQGSVPPWPEAVEAAAVGEQLAANLGIPFYFPSPDHPEDECPPWWERASGMPCTRCSIPILPHHGGERGPHLCHFCRVHSATEAREAQWTPEQRLAPRCTICGAPASDESGVMPLCEGCHARYQSSACAVCGVQVTQRRDHGASTVCRLCAARQQLAELAPAVRRRLREAQGDGYLTAVREVRAALGCGIIEAQEALEVLRGDLAMGRHE